MTKNQLIEWLSKNPKWELDRFGHFKSNDGTFRFKIGTQSVRLEKKVIHAATKYTKESTSWIRLRSQYYSKLSITADGKLVGMVY